MLDLKKHTDNNSKEFNSLIEKHKGELVLDGFDVVKLIDVTDELDDDDFYWVFIVPNEGVLFSTCVGGWTPLKNKLTSKEYANLEQVWNLNVESWLARQTMKIKTRVEETITNNKRWSDEERNRAKQWVAKYRKDLGYRK